MMTTTTTTTTTLRKTTSFIFCCCFYYIIFIIIHEKSKFVDATLYHNNYNNNNNNNNNRFIVRWNHPSIRLATISSSSSSSSQRLLRKRRIRRRKRIVEIVSATTTPPTTSATKATTTTATRRDRDRNFRNEKNQHDIDLLFHQHIDSDTIVSTVRQRMHHIMKQQLIQQQENQKEQSTQLLGTNVVLDLNIDVSHSALKNKGWNQLISSMMIQQDQQQQDPQALTTWKATTKTTTTVADNIQSDNNNIHILSNDDDTIESTTSADSIVTQFTNTTTQLEEDVPTTTTTATTQLQIHLQARMNGITQTGFIIFLQSLLSQKEKEKQQQHEQKIDGISNSSSSSSSLDSSTTIVFQQPHHPNTKIKLVSLDLSFNKLTSVITSPEILDPMDGDNENNKIGKPNNNNNIVLLNKLLQSIIADYTICPTILHLNRCSINPILCRAIALGMVERYTNVSVRPCLTVEKSTTHEHEEKKKKNNNTKEPLSLSLYLCGNTNIGDSGTAAFAAAVREITGTLSDNSNNNNAVASPSSIVKKESDANRVATTTTTSSTSKPSSTTTMLNESTSSSYSFESSYEESPIFDHLDLSSCNVGDVGVQALAIAFDEWYCYYMSPTYLSNTFDQCSSPIKYLDLSNNDRITDQGIIYLGKSLQQQKVPSKISIKNDLHLYLNGNKGITDYGITPLLQPIQDYHTNKLRALEVRSCSLSANGSELLGKVLRKFILSSMNHTTTTVNKRPHEPYHLSIDVSGNTLGVLRVGKGTGGGSSGGSMGISGSGKTKKSFSKQASAAAASYMNTGMSFLKKAGISIPTASTIDSDDEAEENPDGLDSNDGGKVDGIGNDVIDPSKSRCGFKAMANAFMEVTKEEQTLLILKKKSNQMITYPPIIIHLGLRCTGCDMAGADALAAMMISARNEFNVTITLDMNLNPVIEDDMIDALHGTNDILLHEMAERHEHAMELIRQNQERNREAIRIAKARAKAQNVLDRISMKDSYPSDNGDVDEDDYDEVDQRNYDDSDDEVDYI